MKHHAQGSSLHFKTRCQRSQRRSLALERINAFNQYSTVLASASSAPLRETNLIYDLDGQQKSAKGKAPQQPDRDFEACARLNERKSEERIPRHSGNCHIITNGVWSFRWDAENRMVAAYSNDELLVVNAYDDQSRRIRKVTAQGTRSFLYDGWNVLREAAGASTNYFLWGPDLSGTLQGAGGVGGLLAVYKVNAGTTSTYYPCYDANGNITAYVDEFGDVSAEYAYDAFGQTISPSGDMASAFSHRFSTKYADDETGLYYYGYRYYAPGLGRWVSRDPIEEDGGCNLYGFVGNNGIRGIDILGLVGTPAGSWTMAANTVQGVLDYYNTKVYSHNSEVTKYDPRNNEIFLGTGWWDKGAGWRQAQNGEWWVGPIEDGNGKLYNDYAGKNAAKAHELLSVVNYRFPDALGMYGEGAGYTSLAGASHITGLHQLALVYEWGVWAKERPDYLTCAEVTRRESDYIKHKTPLHSKYSANQGYIDEAKRLVDWICDCECGNKKADEKPFESFIYGRERTLKSSKLKERITLQSKFTCKDKKISGGLDVKLETQK